MNARHIKNVTGQHLRDLRALHRHKCKLLHQRIGENNKLQNELEDANIKFGRVVSDVFGKTDIGKVEVLIAGVTDSRELSELARGSLVCKREQLQRAV